MLTKEKKFTKLSKELLFIFLFDLGIFIFSFIVINLVSDKIFYSYYDNNNIILTEMQEITYLTWITALSFIASSAIFLVLFLILISQKLSYLKEITKGIDDLTAHRLNSIIPIKHNNEFTQLAKAINQMAKTEMELKEKEAALALERENFIRAMSHDIRTPLTAIIAHTDYLKSQENISKEDLSQYLNMTGRKAVQIKELTDLLLETDASTAEYIPNGKLFFTQLADEWSYTLEDDFDCKVSIDNDLDFSGEFKVQEFQRIFDNLSSNIKKYANPSKPVILNVYKLDGRLVIEQSNYKAPKDNNVESHKIGLESIKRIANRHDGNIKITENEEIFKISITLFSI